MYNPLASYEENLRKGPSPEWNEGGFFPKIEFTAEPRFSCLGIPLHLPLGIPAGPLLSSAYMKVAIDAGFSMPVYKTVRSSAWASHPWPNVLSVEQLNDRGTQNRPTATVVPLLKSVLSDARKKSGLSITNAFGVPSLSPGEWASDFRTLSELERSPGRTAALSFQGSRREGENWSHFLDDTSLCAQMAAQALSSSGGKFLEMNVSCPNESGAPIYTDFKALTETLQAAAAPLKFFPELKLMVKLGVLPTQNLLGIVELIAKYAHGISAINTLSANIVTPAGERALGSKAEHGGICGDAIRGVALQTISELHRARQALGLEKNSFALVGVGGCSSFEHLEEFLKAGADVVHAATGAMWHLQLAGECADRLGIPYSRKETI
jgi:dihydroorotate dehydrogenase